MKKTKWFVVCMAACMVALFAAGCKNSSDDPDAPDEPVSVPVEAIGLNPTELSLVVGTKKKLTAIVKPDNASGAKVTWSSSKEEVATVGGDGTVTAVKVGKATITAKAGEKEATCEVIVTLCQHHYNGGKCQYCELQMPVFDGGTIDEWGRLTKYTGNKPELDIPEGVTDIGYEAFKDCKTLTKVTIPDGVMSIWLSAFEDCTSLKSVTIPDSVTEIGSRAFSGCKSLNSVTIPDSVTEIKSYAFSGCTSLNSVTIPDSVTEIESYAFYGCTSLASVTIPEGVTKIEHRMFEDCTSLASVTIPDSVTKIESYAFKGCTNLASVTIPDSVTYIENGTFSGCTSLKSVTIPDSVTEIRSHAFYGCTSLKSVTIPASVTSIGEDAFYECKSLTEIKFKGTKAQWTDIEKGNYWNYSTGDYTVKCTDGDIAKEAKE